MLESSADRPRVKLAGSVLLMGAVVLVIISLLNCMPVGSSPINKY